MLIFDSLPSLDHARAFQERVGRDHPQLKSHFHLNVREAQECDPIPVDLRNIVVHVERPDSGDDDAIEYARAQGFADNTPTGAELEQEIAELVVEYGGRFAGT